MADRERYEDLYRLSIALTDDKYDKAVELMNRWIAERVIPDGCAALLIAMLNQAEEWHGGYDMLTCTCEEALSLLQMGRTEDARRKLESAVSAASRKRPSNNPT